MEIREASDGSYEKHQLELKLQRQLESRKKSGKVTEPTVLYDYDYHTSGTFPVEQSDNTQCNTLNPMKEIGAHPGVTLIPTPIKVREGKPRITRCTDSAETHTDRKVPGEPPGDAEFARRAA